jgi:DNA-binding MarR family transcriptional regulator
MAAMDDVHNLFLQEKPTRILVELFRDTSQEKYASLLAKRTDCTYSHTVKVLDTFEENGLVQFEKSGRKKLIELTENGRGLAKQVYELVEDLNQVNGH